MGKKAGENKGDVLAALVAQGWSLRRAATVAGIPETTARRRATEPEFDAAVRQVRKRLLSQTVGRLTKLGDRAARVLGKLLDDSVDAELRFKAARAVLADLLSVQTQADLVDRIEALEERNHAATRRR